MKRPTALAPRRGAGRMGEGEGKEIELRDIRGEFEIPNADPDRITRRLAKAIRDKGGHISKQQDRSFRFHYGGSPKLSWYPYLSAGNVCVEGHADSCKVNYELSLWGARAQCLFGTVVVVGSMAYTALSEHALWPLAMVLPGVVFVWVMGYGVYYVQAKAFFAKRWQECLNDRQG